MMNRKKLKHGGISLALTVVIIAVVILVNAIFTSVAQKKLWYLDMTAENIYSLTESAKDLLKNDFNTDKKVVVTFCSEKDVLESTFEQRMALHTVLDIAAIYPNIEVRYVDIYTNPSSVAEYKLHTTQNINSQSVIVAAQNTNGSMECRIHSLKSLFSFSSDGEMIGYNGEQRIVSSLLAVTRDQMPIACVTTNHGEVDNINLEYLCQVLYETGYEIKPIDLSKEDIPEEARLLVIFDPKSDFNAGSDISAVNELAKLDDFLDDRNAVMAFVDNETPYLKNLEQFLGEWGIQIARYDEVDDGDLRNDINLLVRDKDYSLDTSGYTTVGQFVTGTGGLGYSITSGITSKQNPKSVVFRSSTVFATAEGYVSEMDEEHDTWHYVYYGNAISRISYDVMLSSSSAEAMVGQGGKTIKLSPSQLNTIGLQDPSKQPFSYMKITRENHNNGDGTESYSYVFACSSTDFCSPSALNSFYGNHELLTYACSMMGRDVVSVSLDCKYFASTEIVNITAADATQYTVVLAVIPASIIFVAGVIIMIRRRYA